MAEAETIFALMVTAAVTASLGGLPGVSGALKQAEQTALTTSAAVAGAVPAADPARRWSWPHRPRPQVVRPFDPPDRPWLAGHRGVDLSAQVGQSVLAPTTGQVTFAGVVAGRGVVVITHPNGLRSSFEPVTDRVAVGQRLAAGQSFAVVATVASTTSAAGHCAPQTCLHWGVRRGETYLDPLTLINPAPVVLLPLR